MRWRQLPLMAHTLRSASFTGAMQRAIEAAQAAEQSESLAVSILAGFSLSDIEAPCMSVIVVDAQSPERAQATADRIAAQMWNEREAFIYRSEPLAESIARAKQLAEGASKAGAAARPRRQLHVGRQLRHHGRAAGRAGPGAARHRRGPAVRPRSGGRADRRGRGRRR
jgi:hypothetical protein